MQLKVCMNNIIGPAVRIGFLSVAGTLAVLAVVLCCFLRTRTQGVDTSPSRQSET